MEGHEIGKGGTKRKDRGKGKEGGCKERRGRRKENLSDGGKRGKKKHKKWIDK